MRRSLMAGATLWGLLMPALPACVLWRKTKFVINRLLEKPIVPLIEPLPIDRDPELAELAQFFQRTLGFPPNSVLTMQRRPEIAKAFIALNRAVMANQGRLSSEQKRLVALLASSATGCRYCQAHTALAASRFGASQERLDALWGFRDSALFSEAEKAAFDFTLAVVSLPNSVDADISERLKAHWDEGEIVELLAVISLFGFLNRWNDAMATTLEPAARAHAEQVLAGSDWQVGKHA